MTSPRPPTDVVYTPQRQTLARKIRGLGLLALAWFGLYLAVRAEAHDWDYFREVFPVHLMLAGLVAFCLLYLSYALFHSLGAGYRIRRTAQGLIVEGEGQVREFRWQDIRQVRFGDLYLKLDTVAGRLEIPFIRREDQCEIYRCHQRAVGFQPDPGRFLVRR